MALHNGHSVSHHHPDTFNYTNLQTPPKCFWQQKMKCGVSITLTPPTVPAGAGGDENAVTAFDAGLGSPLLWLLAFVSPRWHFFLYKIQRLWTQWLWSWEAKTQSFFCFGRGQPFSCAARQHCQVVLMCPKVEPKLLVVGESENRIHYK